MNKRPMSVTIIGWLLLAGGIAGFAIHLYEATPQHALEGWNAVILGVEILVLVCGVFVLRGKNWARWLAAAWMGAHVVIGFLDRVSKGVIHIVILLLIIYCLFRREADPYFQPRESAGT